MGYVPPERPAMLYALATIFDVGTQFLRQAGSRWNGLPRTYEEYVERLYGDSTSDHFLLLNYGLLAAVITLIVTVILWLA
jgi:hypothetical protein